MPALIESDAVAPGTLIPQAAWEQPAWSNLRSQIVISKLQAWRRVFAGGKGMHLAQK